MQGRPHHDFEVQQPKEHNVIDWRGMSARNFEKFCAELLEASGFANLRWYGKAGADGGRDLVATKAVAPISGHELNQK